MKNQARRFRSGRIALLFLLIQLASVFNMRAPDFGTVYSGGTLTATVHRYNANPVILDYYSIEAPQSPFFLQSGNLSGVLYPHEETYITFGFEAPTTDLVRTTYTQELLITVNGRTTSKYVNKAVVLGPGIPPVAVIDGGTTACLNTPMTLDGSTSYDPDYSGNGSLAIKRWHWTISEGAGFHMEFSNSITHFTPKLIGTYTVTLVVTDDEQQTGVVSRSFTVRDPKHAFYPDSCPVIGTYPPQEIARAANGSIELQCLAGAFYLSWQGNPDCGSAARYIGACRYSFGQNTLVWTTDECSGRITKIEWNNFEGYVPFTDIFWDDSAGSCRGARDWDQYTFEAASCQLTITTFCRSFDPTTHLEAGPWSSGTQIWRGDAPTSPIVLLGKFHSLPAASVGAVGPVTVRTAVSGVANPGSLTALIRGRSYTVPLIGGEPAASVVNALCVAINSDSNMVAQGVSATITATNVGGGVYLTLTKLGEEDRVFEVVGQGSSGLKVVSAGDIPTISAGIMGTHLLVKWQPSGNAYALETCDSLSDGDSSWAEIPSTNGSVAVAMGAIRQFFRVRFMGEASALARPSSLVAWWTGDGTANDLLSTNYGTFGNGVGFAPGMVGQAFAMDGVSGWVDFGKGAAVAGTGPFSIAQWLKTTQTTTNTLATQQSASGTNGAWSLLLLSGRLQWKTFGENAVGFELLSTRVVNDGLAHYVVGTREADGSGRLYIDGTLEVVQPGTARALVPQNVTIGANMRDLATSSPPSFFSGLLDEIQIYGRALSASEVKAIYDAGASGISKFP